MSCFAMCRRVSMTKDIYSVPVALTAVGFFSDLDSQKLAKSGSSTPPTSKYPTPAVYTMLSYFYRNKSKPSASKKPLSRHKP